jgi:hypothetical protein
MDTLYHCLRMYVYVVFVLCIILNAVRCLLYVLQSVSHCVILLCLHYVMVTVQGITQCIHSIAVPTLCSGNGSGYYTMYPLYCYAYTM